MGGISKDKDIADMGVSLAVFADEMAGRIDDVAISDRFYAESRRLLRRKNYASAITVAVGAVDSTTDKKKRSRAVRNVVNIVNEAVAFNALSNPSVGLSALHGLRNTAEIFYENPQLKASKTLLALWQKCFDIVRTSDSMDPQLLKEQVGQATFTDHEELNLMAKRALAQHFEVPAAR